jgi:transposase
MRRVDCKECGVKVELVPWGEGKSSTTRTFKIFLADWAKYLSWEDVSRRFRVGWGKVAEAVHYVVDWGLKRRSLDGLRSIGVDEKYFGRKGKYWTFVYQIDEGCRRLLHVAEGRAETALESFVDSLRDSVRGGIQYVCSDMWQPYLNVIQKKLGHAVHILDRFHIVSLLNKALDKIRAQEARELNQQGFAMLKHTKYCFLKRPENLTEKQEAKLKEVVQYDLRSVRGYLLKESFQAFWNYRSVYWARWFFRKWCTRAMRSRLDPIKRFVGTLRRHEELIMNWFRAKKALNSGIVEALNRQANSIIGKACGFRTERAMKAQLFHALGALPTPRTTHRFC